MPMHQLSRSARNKQIRATHEDRSAINEASNIIYAKNEICAEGEGEVTTWESSFPSFSANTNVRNWQILERHLVIKADVG